MLKSKKFTLIELLIVVAIIGILAAILLPVLGRVKESARRAVCVSNQHQFYLALSLYADDNTGVFVKGQNNAGHHTVGQMSADFVDQMDSYLSDWSITDCPNYGHKSYYKGDSFNWGYFTGLFYMGGLNQQYFTWTTPQRQSDDPDLVFLSDYNEQPDSQYPTRYNHTASGWYMGATNMYPEDVGLQGSNTTLLGGSTSWRNIEDMKSHSAHNGLTNIQFWW